MNKTMKIINLLVFVLISLAFVCPSSEAGIGVEPTVTEVSIMPGGGGEGVFTVNNDGAKAVLIKVEPEDWIKRKVGEESLIVNSWFKIEPLEFNLEPGEQKKVNYRVILPAGLKGELMAMVFFASMPAEGGVNIKSRFGVALYVAAKGTETLDAEISKVEISKYETESKEKGIQRGIKFAITVKDKGNIHIRPVGEMVIKDKRGKEIKYIDIPKSFPVFAGQEYTYICLWQIDKPEAGEYEAFTALHYGGVYDTQVKTCQKRTAFSINEAGEITQ